MHLLLSLAQGLHEGFTDTMHGWRSALLLTLVGTVQNLKQKHWTEKAREAMTARDWRIFREDHRMSFKNAGPNAPLPFRSWDEMPLPQPLRDAINDLGYVKPSPIQMASMPFGLRQRDVIGLAETGSGKTAAFVLPMLVYIMAQPEMTEQVAAEGPYALVLAPTRELTQQIEEETTKLAKHTCAHFGLQSGQPAFGRFVAGTYCSQHS